MQYLILRKVEILTQYSKEMSTKTLRCMYPSNPEIRSMPVCSDLGSETKKTIAAERTLVRTDSSNR
jgi:hypothetical protein